MGVTIKATLMESLAREGEKAYPRESCGLLGGQKNKGSWELAEALPVKNQSQGPYEFSFDSQERVRREKELVKNGLDLVGFYHSHPDHEAYLSKTDLENSEEYQFGEPWLPPTYAYLVTSVKQGKAAETKAFMVKKGQAVEIRITINAGLRA